jgi:hypothetical protein
MDKARIIYPHPEEIYRFLERLFDEATDRALGASRTYDEEKIADLLGMLAGATYPDDPQSSEGATYKSLAHVAHLYGLTKEQRSKWYDVAKSIPLSQAHVSYITNNVRGRNRLLEEAESLLGKG